MNETAIKDVLHCIGSGFMSSRDAYLAVQNDQPDSWNPLSLIGLGAWGKTTASAPVLTEEEMKKAFAVL